MKKILLTLTMFLTLIGIANAATPLTIDSFLSPNDVTISHLEDFRTGVVNAINSADGDNIQDGTIDADKLNADANPHNRWNEAFNDFVYTGLIPPTSASLSTTTTAGTAYIQGVRVVKDATANTYTASKWTFVDLSKTGVYTYSEATIGGATPSVAADSLRLCRVSSDATTIAAVRDDRVLGISLSIEDHYRSGLSISRTTADPITVGSGILYVGDTRIAKTANTTLAIGTASDWVGGVSGRATSTKGYIVVDTLGNIKLTTTAPTKSDTDGTTTGDLRYSVVSGTYYRVIGFFYMNAVGSGNIDDGQYGNWKDTALAQDIVQVVSTSSTAYASLSTQTPSDNSIPQITEGTQVLACSITPTSATNKLKIDITCVIGQNDTPGDFNTIALHQDTTANAIAAWSFANYSSLTSTYTVSYYMTAGTTSATTFKVRLGPDTATPLYFNGDLTVSGQIYDGTSASGITITEYKQ